MCEWGLIGLDMQFSFQGSQIGVISLPDDLLPAEDPFLKLDSKENRASEQYREAKIPC